MSLYIFLTYNIYYLCCTCINFYDLSAWDDCWFVVYIRRFIYNFFQCVSFRLHGYCGECEGVARTPINHTNWVTVVTPNDCPKNVRNRCVNELVMALLVLSLCPFDISVGVGAFVIGLSQISSFFSSNNLFLPSIYLISLF